MTTITPADNAEAIGISALSRAIKRQIEEGIGYVKVRGEVASLSKAKSGHIYLSLREQNDKLDAVIWRSRVDQIETIPPEGAEIIAEGKVTAFGPSSKYQLSIDRLQLAGEGEILRQLELLRRRLADEGLFDANSKRPLPDFPQRIGVITSATGAVFRDICHRVQARWPSEIVLVPSIVQGTQAVPALIRALERMPAFSPDVVIIGRGGGALEDLWCFNDERLIRAMAAFPLPLISAVGHETDTTLADHVADMRAPTPTAAAELCTPDRQRFISYIADMGDRTGSRVRQLIDVAHQSVDYRAERLARNTVFERATMRHRAVRLARNTVFERATMRHRAVRLLSPQQYLQVRHARLTSLEHRLHRGAPVTKARASFTALQWRPLAFAAERARLTRFAAMPRPPLAHWQKRRADQHLNAHASRYATGMRRLLATKGDMLESLSHHRVLQRGYAIVRHAETGLVLRKVRDFATPSGTPVPAVVQLSDGKIAVAAMPTAETTSSPSDEIKTS
ncbi:MAG: exodeoxyribonuclease VII large subunit [Alphaproteobacteria bacterium]|nr:exodeoxyribonuclease VII large subunit [Alphaproteobacteria bacterium]